MSNFIELEDPPVKVLVRQHARARRFTLRISNKDRQARVSAPIGASQRQVENFVYEHRDWLKKHIDQAPEVEDLAFGGTIPLFGEPHVIEPSDGRGARVLDGHVFLPKHTQNVAAKLRGLCKTLAREHIVPIAEQTATELNRKITGYSFRDTSSRWGSCSSTGRLMFSWRLVLAPRDVLKYVAIHEACHLVEMNHSAAFWALVARQMPAYKASERWLRDHGSSLHRIPL